MPDGAVTNYTYTPDSMVLLQTRQRAASPARFLLSLKRFDVISQIRHSQLDYIPIIWAESAEQSSPHRHVPAAVGRNNILPGDEVHHMDIGERAIILSGELRQVRWALL